MKKIFLSFLFSLFAVHLFAFSKYSTGADYSSKVFKEQEPDDTFKEAMKIIIPVPDVKNRIRGTISKTDDRDIYMLYITRPCSIVVKYGGYSGFAPGVALFNRYKQLVKIKTYASAIEGELNSQIITFNVFKPDFYFLEIKNLTNVQSIFNYIINFIPIDMDSYPWLKQKPVKININNLTQEKLHEIFYKSIIKKFKTFEQYEQYRK